MMRLNWGLLAGAVFLLAACDVIRVPGDGRTPPEPRPDVPEGAPGPPPPMTPVSDPYNEGWDDTDPETPDTETTDPVPPIDDTPEPEPEPEPLPIKFDFYAPGDLRSGSGNGAPDHADYAPGMVFPVKNAPAYPQSMVFRPGGMVGGDQCDPANYSAAWRDNFCERRSKSRNTPLCPTNRVHQGQDIRVGTPAECNQLRRLSPEERTLHDAVAVEDGIVQFIGPYWVTLKGFETGNLYNYIHLNMAALEVAQGEAVTAGQTLGYISNDFGGTPTTFHLHFEIKAPVEGFGITHVPPYLSLLAAYERREQGRGRQIADDTVAIASLPQIPDDVEIIE